jgi:carboxylesterase
MSWHGQINRTIWEIQESIRQKPESVRHRLELLRAHFLQHFEFDRAFHVPRDDRSFLFLHEELAPTCLLLHGAKGTPAEMRDLGNFLYSQGYSVYCPRFSRVDTKERIVSWESWVTQAENALTTVLTVTNETIVIGLSLGGTIGMILSGLHPPKALILLAPALFPKKSLKTRIYELGRVATPTLFYRLAGWSGEVLKAMDHAKRVTKKVEVPVLALQASDDNRLSNRGLKFIRRHAGHPRSEIKILPFGTHILTRGEAKSEVFDRIQSFLDTL